MEQPNQNNTPYQWQDTLDPLTDVPVAPSAPVEEATNEAPTVQVGAHLQPKKPKKSRKNRGCFGSFLWLFIIVVLGVGIAFFGLIGMSDYLGLGKDLLQGQETRSVQIYVEEGATISEIAQQLEEEDVLLSRHLFVLYLKISDKGNNVSYGPHDFTTSMGYGEILESLAVTVPAEEIQVTIPSGKQVDEILQILDEADVCSYEDLRSALENDTFDSALLDDMPAVHNTYEVFEGFLCPDTYLFHRDDTAHDVIQKMLDNLENGFTQQMREDAKAKGLSTYEVLTFASVVETEACGYFAEMPRVAGLFYNRLEDWPEGTRFLQSDPTMYYPHGEGAYNTYKIEGLPPGPISNVTVEALKAVIYPDESVDAYYFVTDKNGRFYYNKTLSAHEQTIADLKSKDLWLSTPYID